MELDAHFIYSHCSVMSHVVRYVVVHDLIDVSMMFVMILTNGVRAIAFDAMQCDLSSCSCCHIVIVLQFAT